MIALACVGLFVGKYPLSIDKLINGDEMQWRVFLTLRCSRIVVGAIGGFALGVAGFVFQTVFRLRRMTFESSNKNYYFR